MSRIRIDYTDDGLRVIDKVNAALAAHGLRFEDDGLVHDGWCEYALTLLVRLDPAPPDPPTRHASNRTGRDERGREGL